MLLYFGQSNEKRSYAAPDRSSPESAAVWRSSVRAPIASAATSAALELEIGVVEHDFTRANFLRRRGAAGMADCNRGLVHRVDLLRIECGLLRRGGPDSERRRAAVADGNLPDRSDARYFSGTGVFTALVPRHAPSPHCRDRFFSRECCFRPVQLVRDAPRDFTCRSGRRRFRRRPSPVAPASSWISCHSAPQDRREIAISSKVQSGDYAPRSVNER